jgi:type VI secretion system (T6SS) effector Hcp
MLTRSSRMRLCAAAIVAVTLGGSAVRAQGNSNKSSLQPVGTLQIGNAGGPVSPIFGFSFSVTSPSAPASGGGAGAGRATLSAVDVSRMPDASSPVLFRNAVLGTHLPAVQITVTGSGKSVPEGTYQLNEAVVSGFSNVDGVERVSFSYRSIEIFVAGAHFCYDVAENAAC